jgi:hypothetical protein
LIPISLRALALNAVVGRAMASLCRSTNSAIDTIASLGFEGTETTETGLDIGPSSISRSSSRRPDNRLSLARYFFSRSARSLAMIRLPNSADVRLRMSSSESESLSGELTLADRASEVRLIGWTSRCELRREDQELCLEVVPSSKGSSKASVSARK